MARNRKAIHELLLPASTGWTRWTGAPGESGLLAAEYAPGPGAFKGDGQRRVLALPAAQLWVLPAWLNGEEAHLRDMAALHLERLGVAVVDPVNGLNVRVVARREGSHLVCLVALKEGAMPLAERRLLPDVILPSAACLPLPADSIVIHRELGRLVVSITHGEALIYTSPLAARELDSHALTELNHVCLQLGFQQVLAQVGAVVLWLPEGANLAEVERVTGLPARSEAPPAPRMPDLPAGAAVALAPPDLLEAQSRSRTRRRLAGVLTVLGLGAAACAGIMAWVLHGVYQERDRLRDEISRLAPAASQVLDQKKSWLEAAPAVDPSTFPAHVLLQLMKPATSQEVAVTSFEWTPAQILLRGRMPKAELALEYASEVTRLEGLSSYRWDTPPPAIASDSSATFEIKGGTAP